MATAADPNRTVNTVHPTRPAADRIVAAAKATLERDPNASMAAIADAAGVSRATVHRRFRTRADLLAAAGVEPDAGTRERVLGAAAGLISRDGLEAMSMDEVAARADVSRASVYRLFPGKPALFEGLLLTYSPFEPAIARLAVIGDEPPEVVIPDLYRSVGPIAAANIGILRAIFFEVTSGSSDALEGIGRPVRAMLAAVGGYLERQMDAGRVARMHPTLAVQTFLGPLIFHLLTRPYAAVVAGLDVSMDDVIDQLGAAALRGLQPRTPQPGVTTQE
jgi:AcrR family transcriptional regulator